MRPRHRPWRDVSRSDREHGSAQGCAHEFLLLKFDALRLGVRGVYEIPGRTELLVVLTYTGRRYGCEGVDVPVISTRTSPQGDGLTSKPHSLEHEIDEDRARRGESTGQPRFRCPTVRGVTASSSSAVPTAPGTAEEHPGPRKNDALRLTGR